MKFGPILGTLATVALGLAACAHEPARDVQTAQTQLTSAEQAARANSIRLDQRQEAERATADQQQADKLKAAEKNLTQANARLDMQRQNVTESSKLQVDRLTAQANGLKEKSATLPPPKKAEFDALWDRYQIQRGDVRNQIEDLGNVPTDAWATSKKTLTDSLDHLSKTVSKLNDIF